MRLAVLRDRADGAAGVSAVVAGLAGVDTGMRQASLALRTLGGAPGLAAFDDRLPEALLLTSPEVAGRLVAVWLGPLLALPPAEPGPAARHAAGVGRDRRVDDPHRGPGALPPQHRDQPAAPDRRR